MKPGFRAGLPASKPDRQRLEPLRDQLLRASRNPSARRRVSLNPEQFGS
jgi:hypothetical protein